LSSEARGRKFSVSDFTAVRSPSQPCLPAPRPHGPECRVRRADAQVGRDDRFFEIPHCKTSRCQEHRGHSHAFAGPPRGIPSFARRATL
jgi:hypothetical protein